MVYEFWVKNNKPTAMSVARQFKIDVFLIRLLIRDFKKHASPNIPNPILDQI